MYSLIKRLLVVLLFTIQQLSAQEYQIDPSKFFSASEIKAAHTALKSDYMQNEEKNIFLYSNLARMYPKQYVEFYKEYLNTRLYLKKDYEDGNKYYASLIRDLKFAKPLDPLDPDRKMYDLAVCWAEEAGQLGITGHDRKTCEYGYQGENCSYGYASGLDIVMQLLIDKDVESLGHRKSILNPEFKGMGAAIRYHKRYTNNAVQNFSKTNDQLRKVENVKKEKFDNFMSTWSASELSAADVCRDLNYLTDTEKDIYQWVNLMRLYPQRFKKEIWDKWSEFGPELTKVGEVDYKIGYDQVASKLSYVAPRKAFVPDEKIVKEARCLGQKWLAKDQTYANCFTQQYSWKLDTFYPESAFVDKLKILTEPDGGNILVLNAAIITIEEEEKELFHVKTIIGL